MSRLLASLLAVAVAVPAVADEFTDTLESALKAYREGDVSATEQDLDYASKLLLSMKSERLAALLPPAPAGWTREDSADNAETSGMMGMFGGGTAASATYHKGEQVIELTLVADSPMVSGMAGMLSGIAGLAGGKPMRINRTEFASNEGELQGVVGGKVLVQAGGDASVEDKTALIETIDFKALEGF